MKRTIKTKARQEGARNLPPLNTPFLFEEFHAVGGFYSEPREAIFFGQCPFTGIYALSFMDTPPDGPRVRLINPYQANKYTIIGQQ